MSRRVCTWKAPRSPTVWSSIGTNSCSMSCSNIQSNPTVPNSRSGCASTGSARKSPRHCASCPPTAPRARSRSTAIPASCASIPEGTDHLLFLCCLVIPFRRLRPLVIIVTAFTVGHSISLIASAFGFVLDALWFPPLIETLIAVTIIYMAVENIVYAALGKLGSDISRRWIIAFAFGVVHGFGFSFALRESLQFAGDHLMTALFGFNVGVEIGQITVLLVLIPALDLIFRYVVADWLGVIIMSVLIAHVAWHWMIERGEQLAKFPFPKIDAAFLASAMRGLMAIMILALAVLLANSWLKRWIQAQKIPPAKDLAADPPSKRS